MGKAGGEAPGQSQLPGSYRLGMGAGSQRLLPPSYSPEPTWNGSKESACSISNRISRLE